MAYLLYIGRRLLAAVPVLLGTTVQFVRGRVLKDTGRDVEPQTLPDGQPFIERRKRDEL